jgi:hypothetical protein
MGKQLITTNITSTAQMPIRKMTLDHLQEAQQEDMKALARHAGTDDAGGSPGTVARDILYGLQSTTVGSSFTCNRGAVYTGGEIYLVTANSFTIGGGQYPIFVLDTSYATGDPTEFTDSNSHNIHRIKAFRVVSGTTGTSGYAGTFSDFTNKNLPAKATLTNGANISSGSVVANRNKLGEVLLQGVLVMNGSFVLGGTLATLPVGHRPLQNIFFITGAFNSSFTYGTIHGQIIASTGVISILADTAGLIGSGTVVFMDNISFYTI